MTLGPFRPGVAASLAWIVAAGLWFWQFHVPWTSSGMFSIASLADTQTVVRLGGLGSHAPSGAGLFLLALPALGALLVLLAGFRTLRMAITRTALAVAGTAVVVIALRVLPDDGAGLSQGAYLAVAGAGAALVGVGLDLGGEILERRSPPRTSTAQVLPGLIAGVLCLVLGVAGAVAVGVDATRDRGGAATPQAAVEEFVTALDEEDYVALIALVAPEQRGDAVTAFTRLDQQMSGESSQPGLADAVTLDLNPAALGFELVAEQGDTARVRLVSGQYAVHLDFASLPSAFAVLEPLFVDGVWAGDLGNPDDEGPLSLFVDGNLDVPVVRIDGRWYVSDVDLAVTHISDVLVGAEKPEFSELPNLILDRLKDRLVGSLADRLGLG